MLVDRTNHLFDLVPMAIYRARSLKRALLNSLARVTLLDSSHVHRLRDTIQTKTDHAFLEDFGISQAKLSFVCKGGWTICDVHNETKRVAKTHLD